eukprot:TRINITY_DN251_c1_g2_i1.p1 TRINITY_DN251_c1_g2~~TRINITY_DN251_c1_g2_i1.p1  ORF type:complete len:272 (-),score=70.80 TRINITY_DN251_c1_g2_i1:36-851(-)
MNGHGAIEDAEIQAVLQRTSISSLDFSTDYTARGSSARSGAVGSDELSEVLARTSLSSLQVDGESLFKKPKKKKKRKKKKNAQASAEPPAALEGIETLAHTVKGSDSLISLSVLYDVEVSAIKCANKLWRDEDLHARDVVYIPKREIGEAERRPDPTSEREMKLMEFMHTSSISDASEGRRLLSIAGWDVDKALRRYAVTQKRANTMLSSPDRERLKTSEPTAIVWDEEDEADAREYRSMGSSFGRTMPVPAVGARLKKRFIKEENDLYDL